MGAAANQVSEAFFFQPASWFEPFNWEHVFEQSAHPPSAPQPVQSEDEKHSNILKNVGISFPIHADLGAGDGGFVCQRARNHPKTNFLAVERLLGRARKIARRARRERLPNVRVVRIEASYAVEHLFSASSVRSMTILFPDPWPKRRHHKNRLIQRPFLEHCAACLEPGGWLAIKTDDASYLEQINMAFSECKGLKRWMEARSETLIPETTDFEREFLKENRPIYFVAAIRT